MNIKKKNKSISFNLRMFKDIGIDLGTANTLVFVKGKGIVLNEPSVVAINQNTGDILAVGNEANEMIGKTPANINAIRPLKNGVIADFNTTRMMVKYFIHKAVKKLTLVKPRVLIGVPLGITQIEKRAVLEASYQAGAKEAYLIEEPIAAAVGAGLPVEDPKGSMIVDIGGGTTEVAILSLGGIVVGKSLRVGGDHMNQALIRYIRKSYNLEIGERTANATKINIGYALNPPEDEKYLIKGRDLTTGLPKHVEISAREVSSSLVESLQAILEAIRITLEKAPPELASDIMESGMTLTGGGALLRNLDDYINQHTHIKVYIADDPLSCVARGTGRALEEIKLLKKLTLHT